MTAIAAELTGQRINAGIALIDAEWAAGNPLDDSLNGLMRIARGASREHTAGLWTLIAWINWRTNNRAAAWRALNLALDIDPDEDPAHYLAVFMHDPRRPPADPPDPLAMTTRKDHRPGPTKEKTMPVTNVLHLHEPAYVLRGKVSPETPPGLDVDSVWLFTGSDVMEGYPGNCRDALAYFAVPRGATEAAADVSQWGAHLADVEDLVAQDVLVKLDPGDQDVISQLSGLRVWLTSAPMAPAPSDASTAYRVGPERMVLISHEAAAVFSKPHDSKSLGQGVARAARSFKVPADQVWSRVGVDLAGILTAGIGFLIREQQTGAFGSSNQLGTAAEPPRSEPQLSNPSRCP